MQNRWLNVTYLVALVVSLLSGAVVGNDEGASQGREVKVGFAEADITPQVGMERPGNYYKQFHNSFHDPCKVRAVVFDNGQSKVVMVSVDALMLRSPQVEYVRKALQERLQIPPSSVLISATHSHSSGPTGMVLPGEFDHASEFVRHLAYVESTMADADYLLRVQDQMVAAVLDAHSRLSAARVGFASGTEADVTFNRRFRMRDGRTQTMPRPGNPQIVEPAGPIDPEVGVIGAWSLDGKFQGCIVNFSCHATAGPAAISANYVYYLERQIRSMLGEEAVVVFLAGASGDINTTNNLSPYIRVAGETAGQLVGSQVGAEAIKQLLLMGTTTDVTLSAQSRHLQIQRRRPSVEKLSKAYSHVRESQQSHQDADWLFAKETILLDAILWLQPVANVEVQAIQVGPAVFVTTPAEYFCQFGLNQKRDSRFPFTFPVSLANDCVGYVPTREALSPTGGGYETRLTSYSNLIPDAGDIMAEAGVRLANAFQPDEVPEPARVAEFQAPWAFGAVPFELD